MKLKFSVPVTKKASDLVAPGEEDCITDQVLWDVLLTVSCTKISSFRSCLSIGCFKYWLGRSHCWEWAAPISYTFSASSYILLPPLTRHRVVRKMQQKVLFFFPVALDREGKFLLPNGSVLTLLVWLQNIPRVYRFKSLTSQSWIHQSIYSFKVINLT